MSPNIQIRGLVQIGRVRTENTNIVFEVSGYGHGVGMSQYGANALSKEGFDYKYILKHYYTGVEIGMV